MLDMGVISQVHGHTSWCTAMVVIQKSNGEVRICVDLTKLNKSILREVHPLPSVDYTSSFSEALSGTDIGDYGPPLKSILS